LFDCGCEYFAVFDVAVLGFVVFIELLGKDEADDVVVAHYCNSEVLLAVVFQQEFEFVCPLS
jgi:hypothetical protein